MENGEETDANGATVAVRFEYIFQLTSALPRARLWDSRNNIGFKKNEKQHFGYLLCLSLFLNTGCGPKERSLSELNQIRENGRTNYVWKHLKAHILKKQESYCKIHCSREIQWPSLLLRQGESPHTHGNLPNGVLNGLYEAYFPDGTPRLSFGVEW